MITVLALCTIKYSFSLLLKHRSDEVNVSSLLRCSRNDIIANVAVVVSAFYIYHPITMARCYERDGVALLFIRSSFAVLKESHEAEKHTEPYSEIRVVANGSQ